MTWWYDNSLTADADQHEFTHSLTSRLASVWYGRHADAMLDGCESGSGVIALAPAWSWCYSPIALNVRDGREKRSAVRTWTRHPIIITSSAQVSMEVHGFRMNDTFTFSIAERATHDDMDAGVLADPNGVFRAREVRCVRSALRALSIRGQEAQWSLIEEWGEAFLRRLTSQAGGSRTQAGLTSLSVDHETIHSVFIRVWYGDDEREGLAMRMINDALMSDTFAKVGVSPWVSRRLNREARDAIAVLTGEPRVAARVRKVFAETDSESEARRILLDQGIGSDRIDASLRPNVAAITVPANLDSLREWTT